MDKDTKAAILTACDENYSGYSDSQIEGEIIRQIKLRKDHAQTRKDYMDSYKELIDECDLKIDFLIGRIGEQDEDDLEAQADAILEAGEVHE